MPVEISVRSNVKEVQKSLTALAYKQLPFATAMALTLLAGEVAAAESANLARTFRKPRPFTTNAIGVVAARKDTLTSKVYMKPITAKYLAPYETGGDHELPGKALLNPKNIRLDQYGQLTRSTLQRLKARSDIFIGPIKTKEGVVNGVWQRLPMKKIKAGKAGRSGKAKDVPDAGKVRTNPQRLKLLIRFGDALPVKKRLNYRSNAQALINRRFKAAFGRAMDMALASAR